MGAAGEAPPLHLVEARGLALRVPRVGNDVDARLRQSFWEQPAILTPWRRYQGTVSSTLDFGGCESTVLWDAKGANLARPQGRPVWGHEGVVVSLMRSLPVARYLGEAFDSNLLYDRTIASSNNSDVG